MSVKVAIELCEKKTVDAKKRKRCVPDSNGKT